MLKNKKGFTIVELLVVISIMGFVSTLAITSLNSARMRARDAKRSADIRQIEKAVQLYHDKYGTYPQPCQGYNTWSGHGANFGNCNTNYILNIGEFLSLLPIDPSDNSGNNGYIYRATTTPAQDFKIMAHMKVESTVITAHSLARCGSSGCVEAYCQNGNAGLINTYAIYTPGAKCW